MPCRRFRVFSLEGQDDHILYHFFLLPSLHIHLLAKRAHGQSNILVRTWEGCLLSANCDWISSGKIMSIIMSLYTKSGQSMVNLHAGDDSPSCLEYRPVIVRCTATANRRKHRVSEPFG